MKKNPILKHFWLQTFWMSKTHIKKSNVIIPVKVLSILKIMLTFTLLRARIQRAR